MRGVSAGLVSRFCSALPPPVSVSREQPVCLARLGFLPIFPLCQTEEEGSREGESSGKLPRGEGGQQRKQEKYIFLSLLSPSKALYSSSFCVSCSPVFSPLHAARLSLCPPLTQTPNPPPFTPHSFLNPKSLLPSLLALFFSIVLPVPLCYPPPPSSPFCLSRLNMPPLSITLLHTPDDCSTPYFLSFSLEPFFFSLFPLLFSLLSSTHPVFFVFLLPPSISFHYAARSNVTPVTITINVRKYRSQIFFFFFCDVGTVTMQLSQCHLPGILSFFSVPSKLQLTPILVTAAILLDVINFL